MQSRQLPLALWTVLGQHVLAAAREETDNSIHIRMVEISASSLVMSMIESGRGPKYAMPWIERVGSIRHAFRMRNEAVTLSNQLAKMGNATESRAANGIAMVIDCNLQRYWRLFAGEVAQGLPSLVFWSWWRSNNTPEHDKDGVGLPVGQAYVREWARATLGISTILADSESWTSIKPTAPKSSREDRRARDDQLYMIRAAAGTLDRALEMAKSTGLDCSRSTIDRAWHRVEEDPERARMLSREVLRFDEDEMKHGKLSNAGRTGNQRVRLAKNRVSVSRSREK